MTMRERGRASCRLGPSSPPRDRSVASKTERLVNFLRASAARPAKAFDDAIFSRMEIPCVIFGKVSLVMDLWVLVITICATLAVSEIYGMKAWIRRKL